MKLKQTLDCTCRVTASYEEGGRCVVKVFASAPYNERGGTATAELAVSEDLKSELASVMKKILAAAETALGESIGEAVHTARRAAKALGESN